MRKCQKWWSQLLFSMSEGDAVQIEALKRMELMQFFRVLTEFENKQKRVDKKLRERQREHDTNRSNRRRS